MDRLFLDANILFSAAYHPHAGLLRLWKLEDVVLCSSRYALAEANMNLQEEVQRKGLSELSAQLHFYEAPQRVLPRGILLPAKDTPILLAAIAADATHLLSGDVRDFGRYFGRRIEGVGILLPGKYLRTRRKWNVLSNR